MYAETLCEVAIEQIRYDCTNKLMFRTIHWSRGRISACLNLYPENLAIIAADNEARFLCGDYYYRHAQ